MIDCGGQEEPSFVEGRVERKAPRDRIILCNHLYLHKATNRKQDTVRVAAPKFLPLDNKSLAPSREVVI